MADLFFKNHYMRQIIIFIAVILFIPCTGITQNSEKIIFDQKDSTNGYYLAIRPSVPDIKGVVILFSSFGRPENLLPETKLHNVAFANGILTVFASLPGKIYADTSAVTRINAILKHVVNKFSADTSRVALAGYDFAGNVVLRYTELTYEHPLEFLLQPRAVFAINSPVDLFALWHWAERQ